MSKYFKVSGRMMPLRGVHPSWVASRLGDVQRIGPGVEEEKDGPLVPGWRGWFRRDRVPSWLARVVVMYCTDPTQDGVCQGWSSEILVGRFGSWEEANESAIKATEAAIRSFEEATGERIPTGHLS